MSVKKVVRRISSLARDFIDNEKNSNNIVDILEYLQVCHTILFVFICTCSIYGY